MDQEHFPHPWTEKIQKLILLEETEVLVSSAMTTMLMSVI